MATGALEEAQTGSISFSNEIELQTDSAVTVEPTFSWAFPSSLMILEFVILITNVVSLLLWSFIVYNWTVGSMSDQLGKGIINLTNIL